ncbi:sensor domain-containing diguanylate cyclase [Rhodocyclus gracilis]|uniref:diguanylate cyclase n=1 Tax=Rhodocyclus tenuis TaxID=1066 RepID=A0A6L5JTB6_RHOTE|nr:diguanylate cyclase [Rhodocyclus gracilis]MQY50633.1 diguanylate cyclase [Rhodocyclus gracilis]
MFRRPLLQHQLVVAGTYLCLALLAQRVFATIDVWPAAGAAVAASLLFGARIWPAIVLGSFFSVLAHFYAIGRPLFSSASVLIVLATVGGNVLASLLVVRLCGRVRRLSSSFGRLRWVLRRFLPAMFAYGLVSALVGVSVYWWLGEPWSISYAEALACWTFSSSVGALIMAPPFIASVCQRYPRRSWRELTPHALATLGLLALAWAIFGPGTAQLSPVLQQSVFIYLPLVYVAVTRSQTFTFLFLALTYFVVWFGTSRGYGPFVSSDTLMSAASMEAFIGISAVMILIVQAMMNAHQRTLKRLKASLAENEQLFSELRQEQHALNSLNATLEQRVATRTDELRALNGKLEALSRIDALTGIANRRHFDEVLAREWSRAARGGQPLGLALLDVDWFKRYNDCYGHQAGDICLRRVARVLAATAKRGGDLVARYGGEEFAFVAPAADLANIQRIAEAVCAAVRDLAMPHELSEFGVVSVSIGVAALLPGKGERPEALLRRADAALYQAKNDGRNRVVADVLAPCVASGRDGKSDDTAPFDVSALSWRDSYLSGNALIDRQHIAIFQCANDLLDASVSGRSSDEIAQIVLRLQGEIAQHFADEEGVLRGVEFPGLDSHAAEHAALLARSDGLAQDYAAGKVGVSALFDFVVHELVSRHAFTTDRAYHAWLGGSGQSVLAS